MAYTNHIDSNVTVTFNITHIQDSHQEPIPIPNSAFNTNNLLSTSMNSNYLSNSIDDDLTFFFDTLDVKSPSTTSSFYDLQPSPFMDNQQYLSSSINDNILDSPLLFPTSPSLYPNSYNNSPSFQSNQSFTGSYNNSPLLYPNSYAGSPNSLQFLGSPINDSLSYVSPIMQQTSTESQQPQQQASPELSLFPPTTKPKETIIFKINQPTIKKPNVKKTTPSGRKAKIHHCPFCAHTSNRANNMKEHIQIHDPDRPKPHLCKLCHKPFARKHDMNRHYISCKKKKHKFM